MKADFTRDSFDPLKKFTRVLQQQGRVQIDADWNEQASILLRYMRTLAADIIGEAGGPEKHCGFALSTDNAFANDFRIGAGRYYVNGLLCENTATEIAVTRPSGFATTEIQISTLILDGVPFSKPQTGEPPQYVELFSDTVPPVIAQITGVDLSSYKLTLNTSVAQIMKSKNPRLRRVVTYLSQVDYPTTVKQPVEANKSYIVFLDVWERLITYAEDDSIREIALNGPDTAARAKLVWQVKMLPGSVGGRYGSPCDNFVPQDTAVIDTMQGAHRGLLRAKAKQDAQSTDPCTTPPQSQYRGVENQLYRVEIHSGGAAWNGVGEAPAGVATFKWSRENGSVIYAVQNIATDANAKTTIVTLENFGRDDRFGLVEGDWVELVNDDSVLLNLAAPLLQVQDIDRSEMTVTLSGIVDATFSASSNKRPILRRWDHRQGDPSEEGLQLASDGAALLIENGIESGDDQWLELEDGVKIQFVPRDATSPSTYRTGDYWLIPARVATGDVEWPTIVDAVSGETISVAMPPDGVVHYYAPLGVISVNSYGVMSIASCRKQFSPLAVRPTYDYAFTSTGIGAANLIAAPLDRIDR